MQREVLGRRPVFAALNRGRQGEMSRLASFTGERPALPPGLVHDMLSQSTSLGFRASSRALK
jgi:hypothetical protein